MTHRIAEVGHRLPKVQRYLQDLDAAGSQLPEGERREVISSIRDHIDEELGEGPVSADRVDQVLAQMGQPEEVMPGPDTVVPPTRPLPWAAIAAVVLGGFGVLGAIAFPPLGLLLGAAAFVTGVIACRTAVVLGTLGAVLGFIAMALAVVALLFFASSDSPPEPGVGAGIPVSLGQ